MAFAPSGEPRDAIAEIHQLRSPNQNYEWVFEADIATCFDEINHRALMDRVAARISDKRACWVWSEHSWPLGFSPRPGINRATHTGTPQGGILSPLLANIALSVLDEHFTRKWEALGPSWTRAKRRREGVLNDVRRLGNRRLGSGRAYASRDGSLGREGVDLMDKRSCM